MRADCTGFRVLGHGIFKNKTSLVLVEGLDKRLGLGRELSGVQVLTEMQSFAIAFPMYCLLLPDFLLIRLRINSGRERHNVRRFGFAHFVRHCLSCMSCKRAAAGVQLQAS